MWSSFDFQKYNRERAAARVTDRPRRLAVLTPEAANYWVGVLTRAHRSVLSEPHEGRPCRYAPWAKALAQIEGVDASWKTLDRYQSNPELAEAGSWDLMSFAWDAALPGWPEDHHHLVEFALAFLEADVMLFRSGYAKRHILRRMRGARLTEAQEARARALCFISVERGTGLEEYKETCRLAARVLDEDDIAALEALSEGTYLTLDDVDAAMMAKMDAAYDEATQNRLVRHDRRLRLRRAFPADFKGDILDVKALPPDNRIKRNAWRMLRHIRRVQSSRKS